MLEDKKIEIGYLGGSTILSTSTAENFLRYFVYIKKFIDWSDPKLADCFNLICDRLYKRYVREDDLDKTINVMEYIQVELFKKNEIKVSYENIKKITSYFKRAVADTLDFKDSFGRYRPLRIIVSTFPYCAIDVEDSLEKLDTWDGPPFWTRFYLKELMDQGKPIPELPF